MCSAETEPAMALQPSMRWLWFGDVSRRVTASEPEDAAGEEPAPAEDAEAVGARETVDRAVTFLPIVSLGSGGAQAQNT